MTIKNKKTREIKFKGKRLILEEDRLYTFYQKANDLQSWAIVEDRGIWRHHEKIGEEKDLIVVGEVKEKELKKYELTSTEATFKDLDGETIISFKEDENPNGFWGDVNERYLIKCKSGKTFVMETGGGTNVMGFPGSQCHGVYISKIIKGTK